MPLPLRATYLGGPTAVLEFHGLRFLTDPTLDRRGEIERAFAVAGLNERLRWLIPGAAVEL